MKNCCGFHQKQAETQDEPPPSAGSSPPESMLTWLGPIGNSPKVAVGRSLHRCSDRNLCNPLTIHSRIGGCV